MTTTEGAVSDHRVRDTNRTNRAGLLLAFAGLVIGTLGDRVLGLWHPEPGADGTFGYALVSSSRETWWAMHFFGSMAVSLESFTLAGLVLVLVRGRGNRWANPGAVLLTLGGLSFAAGLAGEGVLDATIADPDALPSVTGSRLLSYVSEHPERYLVGIVPGLALSTLGTLLLAVGLWRSALVGRIWPVLLGAGVVLSAGVPFGVIGWAVSTVSLTAATLAIGWRAATPGNR